MSEISFTTATSGGELTNEGGAPIVSRGVCWNTSADPTIDNSKTIESGGLGAFTSNITQLTPNTMYYVRAYGMNIAGIGYGNQVSFTTSQVAVPVLTTTTITSISQTTATSGGNISSDGGAPVTARGVCWSTSANPTIADSKTTDGTGTGVFTSSLTSLTNSTTYFVRAYATNSAGIAYGNEISFKTKVLVTSVSLNVLSLTLEIGETFQLLEKIEPETAANKKVKWEISDNQVALVSENGLVTALKIGETIVKVTSEDGNFSATCSVEVRYKFKAFVTDINNNPLSQATVLAFDPATKTYVYGQTNIEGRCVLTSPVEKTVTILVAHPQQKGEIILGQQNSANLIIKMTDSSYGSVLAPGGTCYIIGLSGRLNPINDQLDRTYIYADNISINNGTLQPVWFDSTNSLKLEDAFGVVKNIWIHFIHGSTSFNKLPTKVNMRSDCSFSSG